MILFYVMSRIGKNLRLYARYHLYWQTVRQNNVICVLSLASTAQKIRLLAPY